MPLGSLLGPYATDLFATDPRQQFLVYDFVCVCRSPWAGPAPDAVSHWLVCRLPWFRLLLRPSRTRILRKRTILAPGDVTPHKLLLAVVGYMQVAR